MSSVDEPCEKPFMKLEFRHNQASQDLASAVHGDDRVYRFSTIHHYVKQKSNQMLIILNILFILKQLIIMEISRTMVVIH